MALIRVEKLEEGRDIDGILHHQDLFFLTKVIQIELISCCCNNYSLTDQLDFNKTQELIAQKYYLPNLQKNIETLYQ